MLIISVELVNNAMGYYEKMNPSGALLTSFCEFLQNIKYNWDKVT